MQQANPGKYDLPGFYSLSKFRRSPKKLAVFPQATFGLAERRGKEKGYPKWQVWFRPLCL